MKITFIIADFYGSRCDAIHGGFTSQPKRRTVTIELTGCQEAMLALRVVGKECGADQHEEVDSVFVEHGDKPDPPPPDIQP